MTNRPKQIGTRTETALVTFLRKNGFPTAKRIILAGGKDEGDVDFNPGSFGVMAQVKGGKYAEKASPAQIEGWLDQVANQKDNGAFELAVLVTKTSGYGEKRVNMWDCHMYMHNLIVAIDPDNQVGWWNRAPMGVVTMRVGTFVPFLLAAGYRKPIR